MEVALKINAPEPVDLYRINASVRHGQAVRQAQLDALSVDPADPSCGLKANTPHGADVSVVAAQLRHEVRHLEVIAREVALLIQGSISSAYYSPQAHGSG